MRRAASEHQSPSASAAASRPRVARQLGGGPEPRRRALLEDERPGRRARSRAPGGGWPSAPWSRAREGASRSAVHEAEAGRVELPVGLVEEDHRRLLEQGRGPGSGASACRPRTSPPRRRPGRRGRPRRGAGGGPRGRRLARGSGPRPAGSRGRSGPRKGANGAKEARLAGAQPAVLRAVIVGRRPERCRGPAGSPSTGREAAWTCRSRCARRPSRRALGTSRSRRRGPSGGRSAGRGRPLPQQGRGRRATRLGRRAWA